MRIKLCAGPPIWALAIGTSLLLGCAPSTRARQDALWRAHAAGARAVHDDGVTLFAGAVQLERAALIEAVLARNPDVDAARAGLRAALAAVPQHTALDDPTVSYAVAPLSVVGEHAFGQRVEVQQRLPYPGKRDLAGEAALARAEAAAAAIDEVQLELAAHASALFDDYHVVAAALIVNEQHRVLVTELRHSAEAQYVVGHAAPQDPLAAEVELARLERDRLMLEAARAQLGARLNGLLHRAPDAPLPPPAAELTLAPAPAGTSAELQALALARRPQRDGSRARIRVARAGRSLADRAWYPDLTVMGAYDSMAPMSAHRWMVGVMIDVPLQRGRRRAAVAEADAELARMGAMDSQLEAAIRVEVAVAVQRVDEARALVDVHVERVLPAIRDQLDAARVGFIAAQNGFAAVLDAEDDLREAELGLIGARAELSRRQAGLARAVGWIPGLADGGAR